MGARRHDRLVVAIDGPAGAGKSTVAREVARRRSLRYLDTGAMYRAVTWCVLDRGADPADAAPVAGLAARVHLEVGTDPAQPWIRADGRDVTAEVRSAAVSAAVSLVSAVPAVRTRMVDRQRELIGGGGIVVEGRDIGTTVAPDASVKIFLTADAATRIQRRQEQATGRFDADTDVTGRDRLDAGRAASPLAKAPDAVELDTTTMSVEEVVATVVGLVDQVAAR